MPPQPTPTAILAARGSWRAQTRANEPTPDVVTDYDAPDDLTGKARDVWDAMVPQLVASRILTVADRPAFSRYCRLFAAWDDAMTAVEGNATRARVLTLAKLDEMLRKLEAKLGLTPADRVGLAAEPPPSSNGKARFFDRAS